MISFPSFRLSVFSCSCANRTVAARRQHVHGPRVVRSPEEPLDRALVGCRPVNWGKRCLKTLSGARLPHWLHEIASWPAENAPQSHHVVFLRIRLGVLLGSAAQEVLSVGCGLCALGAVYFLFRGA